MHDCDLEKYYQTGGTYVIPVEIMNDLLEENNQLKDRMDRIFSRITLWKMEDITMETARVLDDLIKIIKGEPNNE